MTAPLDPQPDPSETHQNTVAVGSPKNHAVESAQDDALESALQGKYLAYALQQRHISIRGARTHNLKNIDLDIPRNQLVVITGLSGSGKSSLAFDTLYAEGQRRYVESLSTYARQFLQLMDKPDVDVIEGLSPAISIEQKATSHNPRSTVGTVTEIHDYLRLLFARAGTPYCPDHDLPLQAQTVSQMVDSVLALPPETRLMILAPVAREKKGEFLDVFAEMQAKGYVRFRVDGTAYEYDDLPKLKKTEKHDIDVVIDRIKVRPEMKQRLAESFEAALKLADGRAIAMELAGEQAMESAPELATRPTPEATAGVIKKDSTMRNQNLPHEPIEHLFNAKFACPVCSYSIAELEPRLFSFNSPVGACPTCDGLGHEEFFDPSRVVAFPSLSLASGAIKGWDRRNGYYFSMLESLAKHYKFEVDQAFENLPTAVQNAVLQGSGDEEIKFAYVMDSGQFQGKKVSKKHPFEGVIPNMQRRYRETDSALVREDLARYRNSQPCTDCGGTRLKREARHVYLVDSRAQAEQGGATDPKNQPDNRSHRKSIFEINHATLRESFAYFSALHMPGSKGEIAAKVVREIGLRLKFLNDVGLNYLSLDRSAETLSGGESQRIRLASQIGSGLTGVMYVLDEPSIGLHQRDNDRLIETLKHLRDIGNSVLVVEHDEDMMRAADHVIDMGLGAGVHGGRVIAQGSFDQVLNNADSLTGRYLAGTLSIAVPKRRTPWLPVIETTPNPAAKADKPRFAPSAAAVAWAERQAHHLATQGEVQALKVINANGHNLKGVSVAFPVGLLTCVTGVSGSGKSTLVNDTLYKAVARQLYRAHDEPAAHDSIEGMQYFDKVINVDQSPIGRTPRSNPATYTGLFTPIRELMAEVPVARERGYGPGRFSFNVSQASGGGRCEACQGDGMVKVEMHFLPDVYVPCDVCKGMRYNRETLEVLYKGKNIAQILELTVEAAFEFLKAVPTISRKLQTLLDVGLSYIKLGQAATTLSGGEAQRVKLALELSKRDTGRTLYILDEPTTGLHFADIDLLLKVLHQLRDAGNTIVVIEHNLDVIKTADWLIDMGPEGGAGGGTVVGTGTPEDIAANEASFTGRYLKRLLV